MYRVLSAFGAGLVSFSPLRAAAGAGLSLLYRWAVSGRDEGRQLSSRETLTVIGLSLCFILGFSTVFIAFGASASLIGRWLSAYRYELSILLAV